jgi:proteasome lid subunit RPN8/RPN11
MVQKLDGHLHVIDAFMIDQENSGGDTEMAPEAIAREMFLRKDEEGEMNFWWHSHHSMSAYMSKTDFDTINELGSNGWLLATVFNNKNEHKTVLYTAQPFKLYLDHLQLEVLHPSMTADCIKLADEEFEAKVKEKKYGWPSGSYYGDRRNETEDEADINDWMWVKDTNGNGGGWIYCGPGMYSASFQPPLPFFLSAGVKRGVFKYDKEEDSYRLVPVEQRLLNGMGGKS